MKTRHAVIHPADRKQDANGAYVIEEWMRSIVVSQHEGPCDAACRAEFAKWQDPVERAKLVRQDGELAAEHRDKEVI